MRGSVRVLILVVFGFMIQSSAGFSSSLNEYENVFESGWNLFSIPLIISGQHSPPQITTSTTTVSSWTSTTTQPPQVVNSKPSNHLTVTTDENGFIQFDFNASDDNGIVNVSISDNRNGSLSYVLWNTSGISGVYSLFVYFGVDYDSGGNSIVWIPGAFDFQGNEAFGTYWHLYIHSTTSSTTSTIN